MIFNILVLDDEKMVCNSMKRILEDQEKNIFLSNSFEMAQKTLENEAIDLLLLDYKLDKNDGISVLKYVKEYYPNVVIIMITAFGNIEIAVEAMKLGAYDFIQKKEEPAFIRFVVQRALDNLRLKKEVEELRAVFKDEMKIPAIIAISPKMRKVKELATQYAKTDSTVLITGDTGTGKNVLAKFIHFQSSRFNKPFVSINCSAIPNQLIESELFGYKKGAFTGANEKGKMGLFERAEGGTLFLDEIGEVPLDLQAKLLHVVETGEFFRIGAVEATRVDNRIIAATNCNLQQRVQEQKFRMDLFYRLNIASIHLPSLNERKQDILPLAKYLIDDLNIKLNKSITNIEPEASNYLKSVPWNGNIRELKNCIERAMLLKNDSTLRLNDFTTRVNMAQETNFHPDNQGLFSIQLTPHDNKNLFHEAQLLLVKKALELSGNNKSKAAKLLGIPRTTLHFHIQRFKLLAEEEL